MTDSYHLSPSCTRTMFGRNRRRRRPQKLWICLLALARSSSAFRAPVSGGKRMVGAASVVDREPVKAYTRPSSCCARYRFRHATGLLELDSIRRNPGNYVARCSALSSEELSTSESESVGRETGEPMASGASLMLAEDECFLAADGAEYCVPDPTAAQQPPPPSSNAASSSLGTAAAVATVATSSVAEGSIDVGDGVGGATSLWVMMGLCFLVAIVCALDRVAMSVVIVPMGQVYAYSDTTKGLISSVFSWGYMASIVPSSVFIGVWGPKVTMAAGVLVWSVAQMLSPAAAAASLPTLLACRFAMGAGEAVTMPAVQAIVAERVPQDKRSGWLSLVISGLQIGTVLAYLASPPIIHAWNWEGVFIAYGAMGLVWLALWFPLMPSARAPEGTVKPPARGVAGERGAARVAMADIDAGVNGATRLAAPTPAGSADSAGSLPIETVAFLPSDARLTPVMEQEQFEGADGREAIRDNQGTAPPAAEETGQGKLEGWGMLRGFRSVPWKAYATDGQILTITAAHMAHNWGLYVMLAWLPTYFSQEFSLSLGQSSGASVIPWVAGAITGNMAGWSADSLVNKGTLSVKAVRKVFQTVALVGPAACMLILAQGPKTSTQATLLFTAAVALGSCSSAGFGSSVQDLRSRDTGVIYGMTSACSAVIGSAGTYFTGVLLDTTDSWVLVFQVTAAVYVMGAAIYGAFYRAEPLSPKKES